MATSSADPQNAHGGESDAEAATSAPGSLHTDHLYYGDTELYFCSGKVIAMREEANEKGLHVVVLDATVMHPQGGGQPADTGVIASVDGSTTFEVCHVQQPKDSSYIEHLGKYTDGRQQFSLGEEVRVEIDSEKRQLNARVHSAGHLLDSACTNLGITDLIPSKGYHFPDGAYVEYIGNVSVEKREEMKRKLNMEIQRLIEEAIPVLVTKGKEGGRVVNVGGTECPCGGTHVKNTAVIRGMTVNKIKKSKSNVRVSYSVAG